MRTDIAFLMGELNRHKEQMVFDWNKAARLIKERKPVTAYAGLRGDWDYTGGCIYMAGAPVTNDNTYLASTWAVPEIDLDGKIFECYKMQSAVPDWNCDTKWPQSALDILNGGENVDA